MNEKMSPVIAKPDWLKTSLPSGAVYFDIKKDLRARRLSTVCEEAKCPNIGECWATRTATFMLLGDTCTRACRFCHIKTSSTPAHPDPDEARNVAESCLSMKLKYVVMTMVNRDDLPDGGAAHIVRVIKEVEKLNPGITVELLMGDFGGNETALAHVVESKIAVFAHNVETVERLSPRVRDARAAYKQSLDLLRRAKQIASYPVFTKSAIMLGLGETYDEVVQTLQALRAHDVDIVTMGQYMRPTKKHLSVKEWVRPEIFTQLGTVARELGFRAVASAPLVRSSYKANDVYRQLTQAGG
jgi:lipoic acid synthetase